MPHDDDLPVPVLDPDDALEAKLRLGVLASSLIDRADIMCTDVGLLRQSITGEILQTVASDFTKLVDAMEVLERRSVPPISRRRPGPAA
jgi:hypothetical protein